MHFLTKTVRIMSITVILIYIAACAGYIDRPADEQFLITLPPQHQAVTFLGHACCYIDINGVGIMTDPVFDKSYSIFRRRIIPPPARTAYAATKIILLSHAHRDHLSPETLATFPHSAVIICPQPSAKYISDLAMPVKVLLPGESYRCGDITITGVPAYHPGGRNSLDAEADGRALGYVISTPETTLYYSGDTEYFDGLRLIGEIYHPDLAIFNLNRHLRPDDFIRAAVAVAAPEVIPIHFGAYSGPTSKEGPQWCSELKEILGSMLVTIDVGGSYPIPAPPAPPAPLVKE